MFDEYFTFDEVTAIINSIKPGNQSEVYAFANPELFEVSTDSSRTECTLDGILKGTGYCDVFPGVKELLEITNPAILRLLDDKYKLKSIYVTPTNKLIIMINGGATNVTVGELQLLSHIQQMSYDLAWHPSSFTSWVREVLHEIHEDPISLGTEISYADFVESIVLAKELNIISNDTIKEY